MVFAMNTVIGFACSMGADMGFNSHHHDQHLTETKVHIHADGKKHEHHNEHGKHQHDSNAGTEKGGCCNDGVVKFQHLDKSLNQNIVTALNAPFFTAFVGNFFRINIPESISVRTNKHIAQFFHPPPPDIRVLIQSFQI